MPRPLILDGLDKHRRRRLKLKAEGKKLVRIWLPDPRAPGFRDEARRQAEMVPKNWTDGLALDLISNVRERIDDDEQDPPESWIGFQGESGAGGPERRADGGGNLREARASPDAGQRVETAAG